MIARASAFRLIQAHQLVATFVMLTRPNTALAEMEREEKRRAETILAAAAREFRKRGLRPQVRYIVPRDLAPVATATRVKRTGSTRT